MSTIYYKDLTDSIKRNIETIVNNEITSIRPYAFSGCKKLTTVKLPNVISVGDFAFENCSSLTSIHFAAKNEAAIKKSMRNSGSAINATIYYDL